MALSDSGINLGSVIPRPATYAVTAFLSIALYNVLELTFLLLIVFKRHGGLYFWSFVVASLGIAVYAVGYVLKDFDLAESIPLFNATLIILGWCAMVTGQSLVLYSRLHLIVRRRIILRSVLAMIIINAIILHIPTAVLGYGANSNAWPKFTIPYAIYERIQVTIFFLQELTISGLYMYEMCRLFYMGGTLREMHGEGGRRLMLHLIYMNVVVIILDVAILVLQFTGRYATQTATKGFIYSVKLKLEFNILNRLVEMVQRTNHERQSPLSSEDHPQQELGDTNTDTRPRHRRCSCPWQAIAVRIKHAMNDPNESR